MSLPRYPDYKHSGVDWLGEVPGHWKIERLKNVITLRKITVGDAKDDYTLLSLTLQGVVARDMVNPKGKFPAEFDSYQVVEKDDLVFCLFDVEETPRAVGISPCTGMVTGAYTVGRVKKETSAKYFYNFYLSRDQYKAFKMYYTGLRNVIRSETFSAIPCPVPPINEQIEIANFLDHETAKIDALIAEQEKLIELLKEKRQAVISHAVTKGLDPNVKMKDSGVEWLGQVPEHWLVKKLKYRVKLLSEKSSEASFRIALENIESWSGRLIDTDSEYEGEGVAFSQGDVLFGKLRPYLAKILVAPRPGEAVGDFHVFRPSSETESSFLRYFMVTRSFIDVVDGATFGSKMPRANWDFVGMMPIVAPDRDGQKQIANFLDHETAKIDALITEQTKAVGLLQERRSALISAAVTGQIDVRNFVPEAEPA